MKTDIFEHMEEAWKLDGIPFRLKRSVFKVRKSPIARKFFPTRRMNFGDSVMDFSKGVSRYGFHRRRARPEHVD